MTALKGFSFEGEDKKKEQKDKPPSPPASAKVRANPTEAFKTVPIPRPISDPEDFKPVFMPEGDPSQRKQARIRVYEEILVVYKFLNRRDGASMSDVLKGKLLDISEGGLQVEGPQPKEIQVTSLKAGDILIGMNVFLPYIEGRLKVLGQVTSEKTSDTKGLVCMGVRFLDTDDTARTSLKNFFIASQMPARRKRPPKPD